MTAPVRIQLSRAKGWRMPENTVKVDRTTPWGNPFVVGKAGTAERCVQLFRYLMGGYICVSSPDAIEAQKAYVAHLNAHHTQLRGKNLACWCRAGQPCHADVLLDLVNK